MIFGASGMIGHRIWLECQKIPNASIFGLIKKPKEDFKKFGIFNDNIFEQVNILEWNEVEKILDSIKPDVVVNAIGITIRKTEINDLNQSLEVNSIFPRRLLKWAQQNNSQVIHLSTDCVFDGKDGQYTETSQPSAKDTYGKTKFLGEIEGDSALTLRFSCIGRELASHTELLDWFLSQKGKRVKGFGKALYSGVTTLVVAKEVVKIIQKFPKLKGVFQLSSTPISKYDLLCLIKEKYQIDIIIDRDDLYATDKTLVCDKYKIETGFVSQTWKEMISDLHNNIEVNYNALER